MKYADSAVMATSTGRCQSSTSSSTTMLPPTSRMMPSFAVTPKTTLPMTLPTPISDAPLRVGWTQDDVLDAQHERAARPPGRAAVRAAPVKD
jgi:hypothetical protein